VNACLPAALLPAVAAGPAGYRRVTKAKERAPMRYSIFITGVVLAIALSQARAEPPGTGRAPPCHWPPQ